MEKAYWCKRITVPAPLNQLLVWARKRMLTTDYQTKSDYEVLGENTKYWDYYISDLDNDKYKVILDLVKIIEDTYGLPLTYNGSYVSIWEYGEGDTLPPHKDPDISQVASVVFGLIGGFEVRLNHEETDEVLEAIQYQPGEGIILNNTIYKHSGECLDGYRLALLFSVNPEFDYKGWFIREADNAKHN